MNKKVYWRQTGCKVWRGWRERGPSVQSRIYLQKLLKGAWGKTSFFPFLHFLFHVFPQRHSPSSHTNLGIADSVLSNYPSTIIILFVKSSALGDQSLTSALMIYQVKIQNTFPRRSHISSTGQWFAFWTLWSQQVWSHQKTKQKTERWICY